MANNTTTKEQTNISHQFRGYAQSTPDRQDDYTAFNWLMTNSFSNFRKELLGKHLVIAFVGLRSIMSICQNIRAMRLMWHFTKHDILQKLFLCYGFCSVPLISLWHFEKLCYSCSAAKPFPSSLGRGFCRRYHPIS